VTFTAPSALSLIALLTVAQAPSRDQAIVPTSGTATLSGVVMNDETPAQPVRRAIVVLAGDGLRPSRGAVTDDDGRFSFSGLPAGRFTITASRASFVTSMYGATRPGRPGTAVVRRRRRAGHRHCREAVARRSRRWGHPRRDRSASRRNRGTGAAGPWRRAARDPLEQWRDDE
jgi:hypothetical protein